VDDYRLLAKATGKRWAAEVITMKTSAIILALMLVR